jgi:hypothetical protein
VDAWIYVNRDLNKIWPELRREDAQKLRRYMRKPLQAALKPDQEGRLVPAWLDDESSSHFDIAAALFIRVLMDVEGWRLSMACAECGKYFLRKRRRNTKYCSRKCLRRESSPRMRQVRDQQRAERVKLANVAILEFVKKKRREEWKPWVVGYILRETRQVIFAKSLTRWVNDEIRWPGKGLKIPQQLTFQSPARRSAHKK